MLGVPNFRKLPNYLRDPSGRHHLGGVSGRDSAHGAGAHARALGGSRVAPMFALAGGRKTVQSFCGGSGSWGVLGLRPKLGEDARLPVFDICMCLGALEGTPPSILPIRIYSSSG